MKEELNKIITQAKDELATVTKEAQVLNIKANYLGKKSQISTLMSGLKDMTNEEKKELGAIFNEMKKDLETSINSKLEEIKNKVDISFDNTLPPKYIKGSLHPISIVSKEVTDILKQMGFTVVVGPEMSDEKHNFESLNIPKNHPARDMQDTYWLDSGNLLRSHTSTNQVRAMELYKAPIRICAPGRCFRNEDLDASHDNTFFQLEGMVIDKDVSISNLIYVMKELLKEVFKKDIEVRLRPGFFPFVEPGFELDCSCLICGGKGCQTCKQTGWIELCPCGMIHPNVLSSCGIDTNVYNGFAFGMGLTRLAMMKYKINDIRILNSMDLRKLNKFNIK